MQVEALGRQTAAEEAAPIQLNGSRNRRFDELNYRRPERKLGLSSEIGRSGTIGSTGPSASYLIMASTDGGATWTSKQLKGLERDQHLEGHLMGIHAAKGRAVLVARRRIENPTGTQINYPAAEIDLAGDAWVPNSWLDQDVFTGAPWVAGAFLRSAKVFSEDSTGKVLAATAQEYDLQARVLMQGPILPLPPCEPYKLEAALDGSIAMGACMAGPPLKLCQVSLGVAASQADCWQRLRIPGSLKMSREAVTTPAGIFLVLGDGQNSWAVRLSSAGSMPGCLSLHFHAHRSGKYKDRQ